MEGLNPRALKYFRIIENRYFDASKPLHIKKYEIINNYIFYLDNSSLRNDYKVLQNIVDAIKEVNILQNKNVDYIAKILKLYYSDQLIEYKANLNELSYPNYSWRSRKGRQKNRAIIDQRIANYSTEEKLNHNLFLWFSSIIVLILYFIYTIIIN